MGKHNLASGILVLVVILMIVATTFMVVNYTTGILSAAVSFASTDQLAKLKACGVATPNELVQLKADIPSTLLPAMYAGFPGLMVFIAILMFIAGYFYGNGMQAHHSSTQTTTTTSDQNRSKTTGQYKPGQHVEKTQTNRISTDDEN